MFWWCSVQRLNVESERGQCLTPESDEAVDCNGLAFCEAGEEIFLLRSVCGIQVEYYMIVHGVVYGLFNLLFVKGAQ